MNRIYGIALGVLIVLPGCAEPKDPLPEGAVEVALSAEVPDQEADRAVRWSPKGEQLKLSDSGRDLVTSLLLGPDSVPFELRMARSEGSAHFDLLSVDLNRDGDFSGEERFGTTPEELRNKFWSTFDVVLEIPVPDPWSEGEATNAYPLSLWYVEDPRASEPEMVLRYSRRGWMEGRASLGDKEAVVMLTEGVMDGIFDGDDYWALAPADSADQIFAFDAARSLKEHAWLGEAAWEVTEIDPSGRRVVVIPMDPGMTRAEEVAMNDHLAVDREAARSGRNVAFLHAFAEAEAQASREGKALFVDFETTWCGPCKTMDEWVYTADAVVDAAASLVAVKVDGDEFPELKERFSVEGFPTMILLAPDGTELRRRSGYVGVEDMTAFLGSAG